MPDVPNILKKWDSLALETEQKKKNKPTQEQLNLIQNTSVPRITLGDVKPDADEEEDALDTSGVMIGTADTLGPSDIG